MKDVACYAGTDSIACSVNALYMSGAATLATGSRSVVHVDATYALAVAVGFRPDVAYWIAAYDEVADQSKYTPSDLCGQTSTLAHLATEKIVGFDRMHPTLGGFPYHFGTAHSPLGNGTDTTRISGLFPFRSVVKCSALSPEGEQSQNCMYSKAYSPEPNLEGTAWSLRRWAFALGGLDLSWTNPGSSALLPKTVSSTPAVCMGGFSEVMTLGGTNSYFASDYCLGGQADEGQTVVPVDIRGCMPILNVGTQQSICVEPSDTDSGMGNIYHSASGNQVIAETSDGAPLLYSHELARLLSSDTDGDGQVGTLWLTAPSSTVPAVLAAFGIYLHVLQDRISHHECGDESYSGYGTDEKGAFVEYHYDGTYCGQDEHAKGHWEEVGQSSLPLRSIMGLEYTYDELTKFAEAICASKDSSKTAWLESGRCSADGAFTGPKASRNDVVGRRVTATKYYNGADTYQEGSVTRGLKPVAAIDRVKAIRDAVKSFGGTPLPGTDVTCK